MREKCQLISIIAKQLINTPHNLHLTNQIDFTAVWYFDYIFFSTASFNSSRAN